MKKLCLFIIICFYSVFLSGSGIYASDRLIYFKNFIDRDDKIYKLDTNSWLVSKPIEIGAYFNRSNIAKNKIIFSKYDNTKKSHAFFLYDIEMKTKKFLFFLPTTEKILKFTLSPEAKSFAFSTTNFADRPNIVKMYYYSFSENKIREIFKYSKKETFNNIDYFAWLDESRILINVHQEDIDTHLLVKVIDVNTAKALNLLDIKTEFFKIFSVSDCKKLIVYHPNNGNDKSMDLNLVHIFNIKEKKDFTFFKKKKNFSKNNIIDQIVWAYKSNELFYIEAKGKYNKGSGEFKFENEPTLKKIIIKKPEIPVTVFSSPEGCNIIEIWDDYEKGIFCQLYDKTKEKFKLALIDFNGKIIKEMPYNEKIARAW